MQAKLTKRNIWLIHHLRVYVLLKIMLTPTRQQTQTTQNFIQLLVRTAGVLSNLKTSSFVQCCTAFVLCVFTIIWLPLMLISYKLADTGYLWAIGCVAQNRST